MPKGWAALSRSARWLAVAIATVVLALVVTWLLFVPAADWLAHHDVGSVKGALHETALDNARGRLLTLGAGLFAAAALIFTARNFTLSREGQVTDRYTKATEQLGSDKMDVRIAGVYSLERVARDSARDHPTVMEVLSAFIREHSREPWPDPPEEGRWTRPDVQAALTVVGRRDIKRDIRRIDLYDVHLVKTDLNGADLRGTILNCAYLKRTGLRGANLSGVPLKEATIRDAYLKGANLRGACFMDATLTGVDFTDADLTEAKWPSGTPVPEGWRLDTGSGRLERMPADSGPTGSS
jgi:hypothetical protein